MNIEKNNYIQSANTVVCEDFSKIYPLINIELMKVGMEQDSRNGTTREFIDFKTTLTNPYKRCVGGCGRDINVFFLLAEAMWIFAGRRDTKFLSIFNKNMSNFSDDDENFHAPYGWRLRRYGVSSTDKIESSNIHATQGIDQIEQAINMLSSDSSSRRVVLSIWNSELDLNTKTADVPCNDLLMLKVRDGKLYTKICNRSNDLHWGLPTNIFQFSFLTELISLCLGVELGQQTHDSHSLHLYLNSNTPWTMFENTQLGIDTQDLYDKATFSKIDFNYSRVDDESEHISSIHKLRQTDEIIQRIIKSLETYHKISGDEDCNLFKKEISYNLSTYSEYLEYVFLLLTIFVDYEKSERKQKDKEQSLETLYEMSINSKFSHTDINILALNFFVTRLKNKNTSIILNKVKQSYHQFNLGGY